MATENDNRSSPEFVLEIERLIDAPVKNVWRCWTEGKLLEQWFCPKPWYVTDARVDLRPGGEFAATMNGPNGEKFNNNGVYLEIEPQKRLVSTDAFLRGWIPGERAFMVAESLFEETANRKTRFTFRALHWNEEALEEHCQMGFHEGWGKVVDQLEESAKSLRDSPNLTPPIPKVRTCLWFDDQALQAAEFYCSILPDSRIDRVERYTEDQKFAEPGKVMAVEFTLSGIPYQALNGGPHFKLNEAVSISVKTADQAETDRLWDTLIADGGNESQCGWLKDRFGLSWQIVPTPALELLNGPSAAKVWPALMQMKKIVVSDLESAAR
ncbi:MAG: VOC family protein [Albidovulum sp.]|nr:VOC family protein [Albidovulum sp.]MDE0306965.1 VOC family protein [Albidovulum sp.]MDE0532643.1 VOC family protein [Albidovulum sp.]